MSPDGVGFSSRVGDPVPRMKVSGPDGIGRIGTPDRSQAKTSVDRDGVHVRQTTRVPASITRPVFRCPSRL